MSARRGALVALIVLARCGAGDAPTDSGPPPDDASSRGEPTTLPPCVSGSMQCDGSELETCNAGQWSPTQTCPVACCAGACVDTRADTSNCGSCGVACGAGYVCGSGFSAFTGAMPSGWTQNGSATYDGANAAAQLTPAALGQAGSWVYGHALDIGSVTVQFDFYIGGGTGADGMGFMLETSGATAVGGGGGGLGMAGLGGFGVELDEYDNNACLDSNDNHIGIDALAACNTGMVDTLDVDNAPGFTLADGAWHTMIVDVASGAFTVTANGAKVISAYTPAGWSDAKYHMGFAAGTGGATNFHRVRNVKVSFPSPECY